MTRRAVNPRRRAGLVVAALGGLVYATGCLPTDINAGLPPVAHVLWQASITALGPPALDDQSVYFATRDHSLAAVNRATGDVRWIAFSGISGAPPARDTPVRAADVGVLGDEYLFGMELTAGVRRWEFGKTGGTEPRVGIYPFRTDGTRVYAGSVVGAVFAVDAATGQQVWRVDLMPDGSDNQVRVIAVRDGRAYATLRYDGPFYQARLYALDTGTGTVVWSYDLGRSSLADDAILKPVHAIRFAIPSGARRWQHRRPGCGVGRTALDDCASRGRHHWRRSPDDCVRQHPRGHVHRRHSAAVHCRL